MSCTADGCPLPAEDGGSLCVLHVRREGKSGPALRAAFRALDEAGVVRIAGLFLRGAELDGIVLETKNLRHADLTGASMRDARFDRVGFDFAVVDDVDFEGSVLQRVNFQRSDSVLRCRFHDCLLVEVRWPAVERVGLRCVYEEGPEPDLARANWVYRHLKELYKEQGEHFISGLFFEREMDTRRKLAPARERVWLTLLWISCGYGERPGRLVITFVVVIVGFALAYAALELRGGGRTLHGAFADALYFSVVTFTSLGYGDIAPVGFSRLLAGLESLVGVFAISLFVFVFCRRMMR